MPKPTANPLRVILPFAVGSGIVLGIALMFHQRQPVPLPPTVMRLPSGPGSEPLTVARRTPPKPKARPLPSTPQLVGMSVARSDMAKVSVIQSEPAVEIRAATPVQAVVAKNSAQAMLIDPLPEPEFKPFVDGVEAYLRAVQPAADGIPPVYSAVLHNDVEWLQQLLSEGFSPNSKTVAGDTALCASVWFGLDECVRLLLLHGADANLVGRDQQPPLGLAALRRNNDILKALLLAGANPNARFVCPLPAHLLEDINVNDLKYSLRNDQGVTPLMACTARGDVEGVLALMKHGAKTGIGTTKYYRYPINYSCEQNYLFLSRILLGRSPDAEPSLLVTVDLSQQKAWITRDGTVVDSTSISSGRAGYSTPTGRYVVTDKHKSWISTLYKVPMPWFMRLNCSAIGLHSGHVTGRPASHGCIRLPYEKAKSFFGIVSVGDEVQIIR